jgi:hypothetical protein
MRDRLVCAPADAPWTLPGSTFDRVCSLCGRKVMITPEGLKLLAARGGRMDVICGACFEPRAGEVVSITPPEEIREMIARRVPNFRRYRN